MEQSFSGVAMVNASFLNLLETRIFTTHVLKSTV